MTYVYPILHHHAFMHYYYTLYENDDHSVMMVMRPYMHVFEFTSVGRCVAPHLARSPLLRVQNKPTHTQGTHKCLLYSHIYACDVYMKMDTFACGYFASNNRNLRQTSVCKIIIRYHCRLLFLLRLLLLLLFFCLFVSILPSIQPKMLNVNWRKRTFYGKVQ